MRTLRAWFLRFAGLFHKERRDRELAQEIESHLQLHIEDNIRSGMTPAEARRQALIKFGGVESAKESYRDRRGIPFLEALWQDIRFGLRMLRKSPGFTSVVLLTLALGIGANTAIFSVLNAVVFRPLPYNQPDQLVQLWEDPSGKGSGQNSVSGGVFADWRDQSQCFQHVSALWGIEGNLTGGDQPEHLKGAQVSADFFDLLQVRPILGRTYLPEEGQPGHEQVVILNYALWQRRFRGETSILNQTIRLGGQSYTVVGVLPPDFQFPWRNAQYWIPFGWGSAWWHRNRENNRLQVFGRLKPGVTVDQARAAMNALTERLKPAYPRYKKEWGATIFPLHESLVGDVRLPLFALMGAVSFVLLISCVNVSNLILARTAGRQRELAVRAALGASRWRLTRQLLAESATLGIGGGVLGVLLAFVGRNILVTLAPQDLPRLQEVWIDGSVLAFSSVASFLVGILCGLAPAWGASRLNLDRTLKEGGRSSFARSHQRLSRGLAIAEVGLALMLLVGGGLFLRSFQGLYSTDPGFKPDHLLTMQLNLPEFKYPSGQSRDRFFRELVARVEALPGVKSASVSTGLPFENTHDNGVVLRGRPASEYFGADYDFVTAEHFQTMAIPLLKGRTFTATDSENKAHVAIVSQAFVNACLPHEDPIGKHIIENGQQEIEIVGAVGDIRSHFLALPSKPQYYKPMAATDWTNFNLFIRTTTDPLSFAEPVRKTILTADPDQPVTNVRTMTGVVSASISGPRFLMFLTGSFALVALLLATLGVYGVMAYAVTLRTQETGVRLALGARPVDVLALVLRQGMTTVAVGLICGLAGALALTRFLRGILFGVSPTDPLAIAGVALVLAVAAALACYLPARRAARTDPIEALRCE
jgi:predicted permease